jgi:hypothetical protein
LNAKQRNPSGGIKSQQYEIAISKCHGDFNGATQHGLASFYGYTTGEK